MRLLAMLICFALLMSSLLHPAHAEDSEIKEKLVELKAFIDKQPPFVFEEDIIAKLYFIQELENAIHLIEDNKLKEMCSILNHLFIEIENRLTITDPICRNEVYRRLEELIKSICQD